MNPAIWKLLGFIFVLSVASLYVETAALHSPSVYIFGNIALITLALSSAILLYRWRVPALWIAGSLIGLVIFSWAESKVDSLTVQSEAMLPQILAGDHVVMDVNPGPYKAGDLVVIQIPERSLRILRRIDRLDGSTVFTATDNPARHEQGIFQLVNVKGKALYVAYSWQGSSWKLRKDRTSVFVH